MKSKQKDELKYPRNIKLEKLKEKANKKYSELRKTMSAIERLHKKFFKDSVEYVEIIKDVEGEAQMPLLD